MKLSMTVGLLFLTMLSGFGDDDKTAHHPSDWSMLSDEVKIKLQSQLVDTIAAGGTRSEGMPSLDEITGGLPYIGYEKDEAIQNDEIRQRYIAGNLLMRNPRVRITPDPISSYPVISGEVVNRGNKTIKLIQVTVRLFDYMGNVIAEENALSVNPYGIQPVLYPNGISTFNCMFFPGPANWSGAWDAYITDCIFLIPPETEANTPQR